MKTGHPIVDAITNLKLNEYGKMRILFTSLKKGDRPYHNAALILSDILYIYHAMPIYENGKIARYVKKFENDMLQKSYEEFANQFSLSNKQVKTAIDYLVYQGLVRREYRTVQTPYRRQPNVMFIEPIPESVFTLLKSDNSVKLPKKLGFHRITTQTEKTNTNNSLNTTIPYKEGNGSLEGRTNNLNIYINNQYINKSTTTLNSLNEVVIGVKDLIEFYENNGFGEINVFIINRMHLWGKELTNELVLHAMKEAIERGVWSWAYIEALLKDWRKKGCQSVEDVNHAMQEFRKYKNANVK